MHLVSLRTMLLMKLKVTRFGHLKYFYTAIMVAPIS